MAHLVASFPFFFTLPHIDKEVRDGTNNMLFVFYFVFVFFFLIANGHLGTNSFDFLEIWFAFPVLVPFFPPERYWSEVHIQI